SWDGLFQPFPCPQRRRPSPSNCRVGAHICRFEACSTFTRVTTCLLAASPRRHIGLEGFDGLVASTAAPIASGWSDLVAGCEWHPQEVLDLSRRTNRYDISVCQLPGVASRSRHLARSARRPPGHRRAVAEATRRGPQGFLELVQAALLGYRQAAQAAAAPQPGPAPARRPAGTSRAPARAVPTGDARLHPHGLPPERLSRL